MLQNDKHADEKNHVSTLQSTDWNAEWMRLQRMRRHKDDSQYWNKRSKSFGSKDVPSPYVREFLRLAEVQDGETVLDMGCGTASIAVPLARAGCTVYAADFSQGMLDEAAKRIEAAGVDSVETKLMSWTDDWSAHGLGPESVDVAFASRSISTDDMAQALDKLTITARRRCCITLPTGSSPRVDERVLALCGIGNRQGADHQYAWNILQNKGLYPTCAYIRSARKDTFDTLDEACEDMGRMIHEALGPEGKADAPAALERLASWLEDELVPNEEAGKADEKGNTQKKLRLAHPRVITWAFIAWNKEDAN